MPAIRAVDTCRCARVQWLAAHLVADVTGLDGLQAPEASARRRLDNRCFRWECQTASGLPNALFGHSTFSPFHHCRNVVRATTNDATHGRMH